jgi:hypothetical protein
MENEDEKGERQGLSVLEQVFGLSKIRDSVPQERLDDGLKRLYELSTRLDEERLKKLYDVEKRTRSKFTVAQLERLSKIDEEKDFYLASAATSGFGFRGDNVEKAVEGRNAAYTLDWFGDIFPEFSSKSLPAPSPVPPDEVRDEEAEHRHLEASEKELILVACPVCTARNMLRVQGQIEVTRVPPDPDAEAMTVVTESVSRDDCDCWQCGKRFHVFLRHLEGRKYAVDASLSEKFREPETHVEAVDIRYDYGEKVWQEIVDGKIARTMNLSESRKSREEEG